MLFRMNGRPSAVSSAATGSWSMTEAGPWLEILEIDGLSFFSLVESNPVMATTLYATQFPLGVLLIIPLHLALNLKILPIIASLVPSQ
jgi:hypothetical protein